MSDANCASIIRWRISCLVNRSAIFAFAVPQRLSCHIATESFLFLGRRCFSSLQLCKRKQQKTNKTEQKTEKNMWVLVQTELRYVCCLKRKHPLKLTQKQTKQISDLQVFVMLASHHSSRGVHVRLFLLSLVFCILSGLASNHPSCHYVRTHNVVSVIWCYWFERRIQRHENNIQPTKREKQKNKHTKLLSMCARILSRPQPAVAFCGASSASLFGSSLRCSSSCCGVVRKTKQVKRKITEQIVTKSKEWEMNRTMWRANTSIHRNNKQNEKGLVSDILQPVSAAPAPSSRIDAPGAPSRPEYVPSRSLASHAPKLIQQTQDNTKHQQHKRKNNKTDTQSKQNTTRDKNKVLYLNYFSL